MLQHPSIPSIHHCSDTPPYYILIYHHNKTSPITAHNVTPPLPLPAPNWPHHLHTSLHPTPSHYIPQFYFYPLPASQPARRPAPSTQRTQARGQEPRASHLDGGKKKCTHTHSLVTRHSSRMSVRPSFPRRAALRAGRRAFRMLGLCALPLWCGVHWLGCGRAWVLEGRAAREAYMICGSGRGGRCVPLCLWRW